MNTRAFAFGLPVVERDQLKLRVGDMIVVNPELALKNDRRIWLVVAVHRDAFDTLRLMFLSDDWAEELEISTTPHSYRKTYFVLDISRRRT